MPHGTDWVKEKLDDLSGSSTNRLKSCAVKGCTDASILSEFIPASIVASRLTKWAGSIFRNLDQSSFRPSVL